MAKVVWTEPALDDFRDLLQHAAETSISRAETIGEALLTAANRIAAQPFGGWKVAEFNRDSIRELYVRPFRLIYQIEGDACRIVAVVHAMRDATNTIQERLP